MSRVANATPPRNSKNADDEFHSPGKPATKRQKMSYNMSDDEMATDAATDYAYDANRNAHLKSRRRFNADFSDLQEASRNGVAFSGLKLQKVQAGEDEGSVEIVIGKQTSEHILAANLLISDTSEYPKNHSLFCYSPDTDLSSKLQRIIDEISEDPPRLLGETIAEIMASIARVLGQSQSTPKAISVHSSDASDEEMSDNEGYDAFDDYDGITTEPAEPNSIMGKLQEDFVDIVATEYRPGFIGIGGNDFVISVSLPVITLADSIPPRALMAWDRRLLASSQHLTLLIGGFRGIYPVLEHDASYTSIAHRLGVSLSFKVGLSPKYKPDTEHVKEIVRKHGLIIQDAEDELRIQAELAAQKAKAYDSDYEEDEMSETENVVPEEEVLDPGRFDRFSLSSSLESLLDQSFLKIVYLRRKFGLGWAGAELLISEVEKSQRKEEDIFASMENDFRQADRDERLLGRTTTLPHDPLLELNSTQPFNLPLTAFCYLIRRLSLCTRYCIVCHNKLHSDYEALKPYVCDSKLCSYQYYSMNRGPSLEYEIIHNPKTVDLLVSLAYVSATDDAMEEPFPIGLGLRVPNPGMLVGQTHAQDQNQDGNQSGGSSHQKRRAARELGYGKVLSENDLCDFDELTLPQMRVCIASLIHTLPSVEEMKRHLERRVKAGKYKPKLKDIDPNILPAAWSILRWCVASCTAHIEAIETGDELIVGLESRWTQFRLTVGAPDAEAKFKKALDIAATESSNAAAYPVIYAFHGSPLKNWHSIIRHGLWYKVVTHGRAYGDGVYLAKDAQTSMGGYATSGRSAWSKSASIPTNCMALTEVVNQPLKFVSREPHYVIKDTHWIMCRYLLVKGSGDAESEGVVDKADSKTNLNKPKVPFVSLDPKHPTTIGGKPIAIPDPSYTVETLLRARKSDNVYDEMDEEDLAIFNQDFSRDSKPVHPSSATTHYDLDDDGDYQIPAAVTNRPIQRLMDDWKHDAEYVRSAIEISRLPPLQSSPSASMAIQRELKSMLKEQETAKSLKELGWYMPPELIGDNLYQWIVELHSFDEDLPLMKDMKAQGINSIIFEIRFPPTFPNSPPFFRILTPRFLPFIHGGGGHVTGGGSICMDLLTSDGWLPSYSISAVLMQIRLALSNLEPKPARLARDWKRQYGVEESLTGYKRAAMTHNWTLPDGLDRLVR